MKKMLILVVAVGMGFLFAGCSRLTDDGVRLAETLQQGAKALALSPETELTVSFVPFNGVKQIYTVQIGDNSAIVVWSKRGGSTTSHLPFVRVPTGFHLSKTNEPLQVTLRKTNNAVEVVAVR